MRVLLISANTERVNQATLPIGLALVAAATRQAGHHVDLIDLLQEADPGAATRDAISTYRPEVIGISVRNIDDQCLESPRFLLAQVSGLIEACRASSAAPIVLGGAGYSIFPAAALAYLRADFGVTGDGEVAFPALLARLERHEDPNDLPGVCTAQGRRGRPSVGADLDRLPAAPADLWPTVGPSTDLWIPVQARRGCPLACSYCSTPSIEGRAIRARAPARVAEEIGGLARRGYRRFYFVDSTFNRPPEYAMELCRRLRALRVDAQWRCILYPHEVSADLVGAMADAGCVEVGLGFESGAAPILRAMNKRFGPEEVRTICETLAGRGIARMGFLLLGGPGETQQTVDESLAFAASLPLSALRVTTGIRIYPGTPLAQIAVRDGVIEPDDDLLTPRFYLTPGLRLPAAAPA